MTTYTVSNNNNSGNGSLRWAVNQANANTGLDTINFAPEVTYINLEFPITISDSLIINGKDATVAQTANYRIFNIGDNTDESIDVSLNELTLTGGRPNEFGGAIFNKENLTINETTIVDNITAKRGGAIYSEAGSLTITNSNLRQNKITDGDTSIGGAVYVNNGTFLVSNTTFENNQSSDSVVSINNSTAQVTNSKFDSNNGGAIAIAGNTETTIERAEIINNTSQTNGAGIVIIDSDRTSITDSIIKNNQSLNGGGIFINNSQVEVFQTGVVNNTATEAGGGVLVEGTSSFDISNSNISGNSAPTASALATRGEDSDAAIANVAIFDNTGSETQLDGENITFGGGNIGGVLNPNPLPEEPTLELITVERFYQYEQGFHFYTADNNESQTIRTQSEDGLLSYRYENTAYSALANNTDALTGEIIEGARSVYRFFNQTTGAHLYTMDENEKGYIQDNLADYSFEGIAYYAFESEQTGFETIPVYRMLNGDNGTHLFSADQNEINYIQDNLDNYSLEGNGGIAFHVFGVLV